MKIQRVIQELESIDNREGKVNYLIAIIKKFGFETFDKIKYHILTSELREKYIDVLHEVEKVTEWIPRNVDVLISKIRDLLQAGDVGNYLAIQFMIKCLDYKDCRGVVLEAIKKDPIVKNIYYQTQVRRSELKPKLTIVESREKQRFILDEKPERIDKDVEVIKSDAEVIENDVEVIEDEVDRLWLNQVDYEVVQVEDFWKKYLNVKELKQLYPGTWRDKLLEELLKKELRKRRLNVSVHELKKLYPVTYRKLLKKVEKKLKKFEKLVDGDVHEDHKD